MDNAGKTQRCRRTTFYPTKIAQPTQWNERVLAARVLTLKSCFLWQRLAFYLGYVANHALSAGVVG